MIQRLGVAHMVVRPNDLYFLFKTLNFFLLGVPVVLGFISAFNFKFVQVQLPRPSLWMSYLYT